MVVVASRWPSVAVGGDVFLGDAIAGFHGGAVLLGNVIAGGQTHCKSGFQVALDCELQLQVSMVTRCYWGMLLQVKVA